MNNPAEMACKTFKDRVVHKTGGPNRIRTDDLQVMS